MSTAEPETSVAAPFVWMDTPAGRALTCEALSGLAPHVFTTRDVTFHEDRAPGDWRRLGQALSIGADAIVRVSQVHGRVVVVAGTGNEQGSGPPGEPGEINERVRADAIVSLDPARAVAVRIADCVPILLADRSHRVVAAIHAGWRGTAAGVVRAAVDAIRDAGIEPMTLVAALGPSIGPCCYAVGDEVRNTFLAATPDAVPWFAEAGPGRWMLDLWRANADQLEDAGLGAGAIHVARWCTADHPADCFSYRRDGAGTGRMVAAIRIATAVVDASRRGLDVRT